MHSKIVACLHFQAELGFYMKKNCTPKKKKKKEKGTKRKLHLETLLFACQIGPKVIWSDKGDRVVLDLHPRRTGFILMKADLHVSILQ